MDVESRDAGTEDLQRVVVEMVPHGPGDGLCRNHLASRRKPGGRRPVCGSTAEAIDSIYGVHCTGRARGGARCGRLTSVWIPGIRSDAPQRSGMRCDLGPASADPTLAETPRVPPRPAAVRMRDVPRRRGGRAADHEGLGDIGLGIVKKRSGRLGPRLGGGRAPVGCSPGVDWPIARSFIARAACR